MMMSTKLWLSTVSLLSVLGQGRSEPSPASVAPPVAVQSDSGQRHEESKVSRDEPFGFRMGMSKAELQRISGTTLRSVPNFPRMFELHSVPRPEPYFDTFGLLIGPRSGLCELSASGPKLSARDVENTFSSIRSKIDLIYGGTHALDSPPFGASASRPRPFPATPNTVSATWSAASGANMGRTIQSIRLSVLPGGDKAHRIHLQYIFDNAESCIVER